MSDILDSFPDVPVKFWLCPDHRGRVEWTGKVATCLECGRTNQPAAVPSTSDEDAHVRFLTNERTTLVARCEELYAALAAARAEIAAQAATITELRARISRFDVGNPYGWTPDEIARREQASAELDKLVDRDD